MNERAMIQFRTLKRLVPLFVSLFVVAQLAGVVPRLAYSQPASQTAAAHIDHKHAHDHADVNKSIHHHPDDQHGNIADQCCALHLLAGVVPLVVMASLIELPSRPLAVTPAESIAGLDSTPLDRPPRSLSSF